MCVAYIIKSGYWLDTGGHRRSWREETCDWLERRKGRGKVMWLYFNCYATFGWYLWEAYCFWGEKEEQWLWERGEAGVRRSEERGGCGGDVFYEIRINNEKKHNRKLKFCDKIDVISIIFSTFLCKLLTKFLNYSLFHSFCSFPYNPTWQKWKAALKLRKK